MRFLVMFVTAVRVLFLIKFNQNRAPGLDRTQATLVGAERFDALFSNKQTKEFTKERNKHLQQYSDLWLLTVCLYQRCYQ